jgi:aryl-alcohol dehydrogenase-like predicted oxidoreductase
LIKRALELGGVELLDRVDRLQSIAQRANCTMPQVAIAWLLRRGAISSVIIGATSVVQVEENVASTGIELTPDDVTQIEALFPPEVQGAGGQGSVHPRVS